MKKNKYTDYFRGMRAALPVIFGFVPVAIAYAIMAGRAGLSNGQTVALSLSVFAGASQMMATAMLTQGSDLLSIVVATFILNLRHVIMSTCIFNRMKPAKLGWRLLAAFGVTDESFAFFTTTEEEKCTLPYFFGLITVTYSSWILGTVIGTITADFLPPRLNDSLGIALFAMFIALLVPNIRKRLRLIRPVLLTAALHLSLQYCLPSGWALIVATIGGAAAGVYLVGDDPEAATAPPQKEADR
jgi:4-azaleucine resistance transporter AzlC